MQFVRPKLKATLVAEEVQRWLTKGEFLPGDRLPSEQAMAKKLRMNHLTVRRGLADLASKGIIEKKRNIGNFVAAAPVSEMAIVLPRFVVNRDSPHPYFSQVLAGIQSNLHQKKPAVLILSYRPGHLWEDVRPVLASGRIRGMILAPGADVGTKDVERIRRSGTKIVLIKTALKLAPLQIPSVEIDMMGATAELLEGILRRGHRRIVIVQYAGDPLRVSSRALIDAILHRWGGQGVEISYLDVPSDDQIIDYSVLERIFDEGHRPSAVMMFDEFMASAMFRLCYRKEIRIPTDLSLAAVLDSVPSLHPVPLTAGDSAVAGREHGRIAADLLLRLIAGERPAERRIFVGCDIHWQASLADLNARAAGDSGNRDADFQETFAPAAHRGEASEPISVCGGT
jgi:DNA-binding LacI/PurR family transcriptional regulator